MSEQHRSLHSAMVAFRRKRRDKTPEELAEEFIKTHRGTSLRELLRREFAALERQATRTVEIHMLSASPAPRRPLRSSSEVQRELETLTPLLSHTYRLGNGAAREFGQMTAEEHTARIVANNSKIDGLKRSNEVHERALAILRRTGATCLDEVDGEVAV